MNRSEQDAPKSRGQRRMKELAVDYERTRVELEKAILAEVSGEPGALAQIAAEALSSAVMGARRKRAAGRSDAELLKLCAQLMRASGLRPAPVQAAVPPSPYAMLLNTETDEDDGEGDG